MDSKHERERAFHNQAFAQGTRESVGSYYNYIDNSTTCFRQILARHSADSSRVLEYGCGQGSHAFYLAGRGAVVTGIDLSDVAIDQGRERARREGLDITFRVMDAERLDFQDDAFDLICGVAILHHLDLHKAFSEVARTLRPDGIAVFFEPLGHNPLINLYRRFTPRLRTIDEHPLLMEDLQRIDAYFNTVELCFFNLQALLALPFRRLRGFKTIFHTLDAADQMLFRMAPFTKRYAWQVIMSLSSPNKRSITG
jgi:SAM-dependent methyltransferase